MKDVASARADRPHILGNRPSEWTESISILSDLASMNENIPVVIDDQNLAELTSVRTTLDILCNLCAFRWIDRSDPDRALIKY